MFGSFGETFLENLHAYYSSNLGHTMSYLVSSKRHTMHMPKRWWPSWVHLDSTTWLVVRHVLPDHDVNPSMCVHSSLGCTVFRTALRRWWGRMSSRRSLTRHKIIGKGSRFCLRFVRLRRWWSGLVSMLKKGDGMQWGGRRHSAVELVGKRVGTDWLPTWGETETMLPRLLWLSTWF